MTEESGDSELISEFLRTKSEYSFLQIYRRHTPRLYLFALRLSGGRSQEAEELVQESWIRAVRKLSTFQKDAKFMNWLIGIACNCYREFQKNKRAGLYCANPGAEPAVTTTSLQVEQLIGMLPEGSREVLILHDLYGYTHEETASLLNIQPGTSKSQLFEARKKLRTWLQKEEL